MGEISYAPLIEDIVGKWCDVSDVVETTLEVVPKNLGVWSSSFDTAFELPQVHITQLVPRFLAQEIELYELMDEGTIV